MKINTMNLLVALSLLMLACKKDKGGDMNKPATDMVKGKVLTSDGRPVSGARIIISSVIWYNENTVATTGAEGTYSKKLAGLDSDAFYAYASIQKDYNGKRYTMDLHPESTDDFFPADGAVRNFIWKLTGPQVGRSTGIYGGQVTVASEPGAFYDFTNVTLTMVPQGALIDGSNGSTITMKVPNSQKLEVPIGRYLISAVYAPAGQGQKTMKIRLSDTGSYNNSVLVDFSPSTDFCKNCLTLDVKE